MLLSAVSSSFGAVIGIVDFENFSNSLISIKSVHDGPPTGLISGPPGSYSFAVSEALPTIFGPSGWFGISNIGYGTP